MATAISTAVKADPIVVDITTIADLAAFNGLEPQWNRLVTTHNNSLFLRHEFLRVWLESFAPGESLEILAGWSSEGQLAAALPLMRQRGSVRGIPVQQLAGTCNVHSCRCDLIAENPAVAGEAMFRHLAARNDWDVIQIRSE